MKVESRYRSNKDEFRSLASGMGLDAHDYINYYYHSAW
ncbi:hypothetical protein T02_10882 [Trichinella nativa]|uniref:Uncharacterized protein n=1 Tax=Trichinella nativa TaxID=6335 RepID=A0A0V1L650_9BILA|nr:hypothetical protein T02_10882 [Trichinella nativa]